MTARIRVKADRIISEYEKFKTDIARSLELETEHNSLVQDYIDKDRFHSNLKYKNPIYFSSWTHLLRKYEATTALSEMSKLNGLASKSDDGFVEIDDDMSRFISIDVNSIEKSILNDIEYMKSMIADIDKRMEELSNPAHETTTQDTKPYEPAPWPEPTTMDMSGFYIPCIGAFLVIGLLAVIFGAL